MKTVLIWLKLNHEILKAVVPALGTAAFSCSTRSDKKVKKTTIFHYFCKPPLYNAAKKARYRTDGSMPVTAKSVIN